MGSIEAGHQAIRFLQLNDAQRATLRANLIEHRTYPLGVRVSVFRDVPDVAEALGMQAADERAA
jgi:hypothetical protein